MEKKRLVVFLDGTWNDPDDNTNVWRMKLMMAGRDEGGVRQLAYYDPGVGTRWHDRLRGGLFATGLTKNLREAYQWLMENHDSEDDEIFIFGFSRGAFTARSLVGMIKEVGLLAPDAPMSVAQIYQRYELVNNDKAESIYDISKHTTDRTEQWIRRCSRRVPIQFLGLWDTVPGLSFKIPGIKSTRARDHNIYPTVLIKNAFHALAIDEHRKPYRPSFLNRFHPDENGHPLEKPAPAGQVIEHRWFIGAHSNVGGGYRNNPLGSIPLAWMQGKASSCGLAFRRMIELSGDEHLGPKEDVVDSFGKFLKGTYKVLKLWRRYRREIGRDHRQVTVEKTGGPGWVRPINERIDGTVFERWRKQELEYRPKNVRAWLDRHGLGAKAIRGDVSAQAPAKELNPG